MSANKDNYMTGEKAPAGVYVCMNCTGNDPEAVIMPDMGTSENKLPECKKCGYTYWYKT